MIAVGMAIAGIPSSPLLSPSQRYSKCLALNHFFPSSVRHETPSRRPPAREPGELHFQKLAKLKRCNIPFLA